MQKVLITGAAGYIGSYVAKRLTQEDYYVIALDNEFRGNYRYLRRAVSPDAKIEIINGDISDPDLIQRIIDKNMDIEYIIHLAAIPGLELCRKYPEDAVRTNVYGTYNLLDKAKKLDGATFIFASSAAVYGTPSTIPVPEDEETKPINLYGVTKESGEKLCRIYSENGDMKVIILRFGNVYGLGLYTYWATVIPKFVKQALTTGKLTIYGDGEQTRDFIHVRDLTRAIELLINKNPGVEYEVYNVANGEAISVNKIAETVEEAAMEKLGREIDRIYLPPRPEEVNVKNFHLSNSKIKMLGYRPRENLKEAIEELIDYYKRSIN